MKRFICSILTILLLFPTSLAYGNYEKGSAKKKENVQVEKVIVGDQEYIFTSIIEDHKNTVRVKDGSVTHEAVYNTETGELFLDGKKVGGDDVAFLKALGSNEENNLSNASLSSLDTNLNDSVVSPYSYQDPGTGGSEWKWIAAYDGSVNVISATVPLIAAGIAALLIKDKTLKAIVYTASVILAAFTMNNFTYHYKIDVWERPDPAWNGLIKERERDIKIYRYANQIGLIHRLSFR